MKQITEEQFATIIRNQDREGLKRILTEYLDSDMTPEEVGEIHVKLLMAYMKTANEMNEAMHEDLQEIINALKQIDVMEKEGIDKINIAAIRNQIKDL